MPIASRSRTRRPGRRSTSSRPCLQIWGASSPNSAMPKRFDLVVFDWDGTLIDSAGAIVASIQAACRDLDVPVPACEAASHVIGLGLSDALAYAIPGLSPDLYPRVAERYRH